MPLQKVDTDTDSDTVSQLMEDLMRRLKYSVKKYVEGNLFLNAKKVDTLHTSKSSRLQNF
jgi:hypothetical protein